jgi:hypothetical protein
VPSSWENLGVVFTANPSVLSRTANRLDIFGRGTSGAMYHKAWTGTAWTAGYQNLGGAFAVPAVQ